MTLTSKSYMGMKKCITAGPNSNNFHGHPGRRTINGAFSATRIWQSATKTESKFSVGISRCLLAHNSLNFALKEINSWKVVLVNRSMARSVPGWKERQASPDRMHDVSWPCLWQVHFPLPSRPDANGGELTPRYSLLPREESWVKQAKHWDALVSSHVAAVLQAPSISPALRRALLRIPDG